MQILVLIMSLILPMKCMLCEYTTLGTHGLLRSVSPSTNAIDCLVSPSDKEVGIEAESYKMTIYETGCRAGYDS